MSSHSPIRLAIVGAGIFARDAHLPAILSLGDAFEIVAVCTRQPSTAGPLLDLLPRPVEVVADLSAVLAREDVEAVDLVLPIDVMAPAVEQALAAGKHIISEKPMAPDVATGRRLLAQYAATSGQVWMVAENWRCETAFVVAEEIIRRGEIGRLRLCSWSVPVSMTADNKYYRTDWRRSGTWPGGFLLDGGVHYAAVLRLLVGEIASVSAVTAQFRPDLPPADTLSAVIQFENSAVGAYNTTFAAGAPWPSWLHIVGDQGAIQVRDGELIVTSAGTTRQIAVPATQGVRSEFAAFAAAVRQGRPHVNSPAEGLRDVAVIEAMLRSAATGQRVAPERVV
jgi:predicted dehydrogenase